MENNANANGEEVEEMEFDCDVMDNASTMRKGDNTREFDCNEIHGNSHDFIGQDPPPNSRGTNFSPVFFTQHDSVPDLLEVRKVFEPPPSPEWSYRWSRSSWDDYDEPPMLPPLLAATDMYGVSTEPHFATLSHLYIEQSPHGAAGAAISSTERLQDKYVTVVVDKPSDR